MDNLKQLYKIIEQYEQCEQNENIKPAENNIIEEIEYIDINKLSKEEIEYYEKIGEEIITQGKYAIVTMAGGQRNKTRT